MKKILIADNIEQNLILMSTHFIDSGYEVITANTGNLALKKARMLMPNLIILELGMIDISGYDICRILKSEKETKDIMILTVTTMDSKEARNRAFYMGADEYLAKPFDKNKLMSKIKSLLRLMDLNDELQNQYKAIKETNLQLESQLKMARQIQQALVPKYNDVINGIEFNSKYKPAIDIGGDYYEVYTLDDNIVCVFMADVSGHGISAALLTSMIKIMFKKYVKYKLRPNEILENMNNEFCSIFADSDISVYTCAFISYIDTKNKVITSSNAGHALPIFVKSKLYDIEEIDISGTPLGMIDNMPYDEKQFSYDLGDMMFFYTDGLSDCFYKESPDDFVIDIKKILLGMKDESSNDILNTILEHMYNFDVNAKYQNDDVSMILCKL